MKYNQLKNLNDEQFRRLTGLKISIFAKMLEILRKEDQKKKAKGKPKNKLSIIALEYIRVYRRYFHIDNSCIA